MSEFYTELYRIVVGSDVYTLTSGADPVDYNAETYVPDSIGRGDMEQGQDINRENIQIQIPRTSGIAQIYLQSSPDVTASVTIFAHTVSETAILWKGRIASVSASDSEAIIECESVFTSLRRPGLRARFSKLCRHDLYGDSGCKVNKANHATEIAFESYSERTIISPDAAALPDKWLNGGMVEDADGTLRFILEHNSDQLVLSWPMPSLAALSFGWGNNWGSYYGSPTIIAYPGCDKLLATCDSKFSNNLNYGGFPWIPSKNPLGGSNVF